MDNPANNITCILNPDILAKRLCSHICYADTPCILIINGMSNNAHKELLENKKPVQYKICGYECPRAKNIILANFLTTEIIKKLRNKNCEKLQSCLPKI